MAKLIDLTGNRYGRLFVKSRAKNSKAGQANWNVLCDCGKELAVSSNRLRNAGQQSCGCIRNEKNSKNRYKDLTGKKFGYLTVEEFIEKDPKKGSLWKCKCECGTKREYRSSQLPSRQSCGCMTGKIISQKRRTHGKTGTRAYWLRALAKKRARDRGLPFNITIDYVQHMIDTTPQCPYLGIELKTNKGSLAWNSATIDRIIPELGYVIGNVMLISHRANTIKNDATADEVMAVAVMMKQVTKGGLPSHFRADWHSDEAALDRGVLLSC